MTTHLYPHTSHPTHTAAATPGRNHHLPQRSAHTATHLLAGQTRVIHASEGLTLHVLQGRLWLTQPGDPADRFMCAGDTIELAMDWVVVEADAVRRARPGQPEHATAYRLVPQSQPVRAGQVANRQLWPALRKLFDSGRRLGFSWA
jgi:hypothetical protein